MLALIHRPTTKDSRDPRLPSRILYIMLSLTTLAVLTVVIAVSLQRFSPSFLPYGPAVPLDDERGPHRGPRADPANISLRLSSKKLTKIYERVEEGKDPLVIKPETVILNNDGQIFLLSENGSLVTLVDIRETDEPFISTARALEVAHLGVGRPLSGKFDEAGCLYFVDVIMGLARICINDNDNTHHSHVELLASRVKLEDGSHSPINYADDIDVGQETGHIYFSDATDVRSDRDVRTGRWDIMYGSKVDGIRMNLSGRLLRYKPETGEVDVLATGVAFANGVALDKDETFVLFASTYDRGKPYPGIGTR